MAERRGVLLAQMRRGARSIAGEFRVRRQGIEAEFRLRREGIEAKLVLTPSVLDRMLFKTVALGWA
jgi:hypothetical protein